MSESKTAGGMVRALFSFVMTLVVAFLLLLLVIPTIFPTSETQEHISEETVESYKNQHDYNNCTVKNKTSQRSTITTVNLSNRKEQRKQTQHFIDTDCGVFNISWYQKRSIKVGNTYDFSTKKDKSLEQIQEFNLVQNKNS